MTILVLCLVNESGREAVNAIFVTRTVTEKEFGDGEVAEDVMTRAISAVFRLRNLHLLIAILIMQARNSMFANITE